MYHSKCLRLHVWQLPYSRAGFVRVNLTAAAADVSGDVSGGLSGGLRGGLSGVDVGGDVSGGGRGDVSGSLMDGPSRAPLRVDLRHEEEGGGAFAAIVLGGAEHPFALAAWGRSELDLDLADRPQSEEGHASTGHASTQLEDGARSARSERSTSRSRSARSAPPLEAGRLVEPSDFSLLVELWRVDGSHRYRQSKDYST